MKTVNRIQIFIKTFMNTKQKCIQHKALYRYF